MHQIESCLHKLDSLLHLHAKAAETWWLDRIQPGKKMSQGSNIPPPEAAVLENFDLVSSL